MHRYEGKESRTQLENDDVLDVQTIAKTSVLFRKITKSIEYM